MNPMEDKSPPVEAELAAFLTGQEAAAEETAVWGGGISAVGRGPGLASGRRTTRLAGGGDRRVTYVQRGSQLPR